MSRFEERSTERARQVVVFAREEAHALRHAYLGTEHILLGLLREQGGIAYWKQIVLFERSGKKIESRAGWNNDLCHETDKLLDGAKPVP